MGWRWVAGGLVFIAGLLGSNPAPAMGPAWSYAEYFRLSGSQHYNDSVYGDAARLSVPLGEFLYFGATWDRLDAQYDTGGVAEHLAAGTAGLGLHTTGASNQLFVLVNYAEKRLEQYAPTSHVDRAEGPGVAVGMRWLATPYLAIEPQGGLKGYYWDGFLRLTLAARLLPHVWAAGEYNYNVINGPEWLAGLRLTWSDYTPARLPNAVVAGASPDRMLETDLAAGQTLITLRAVVPQVRPAAGAPELAPLPKDTKIVLQESISNEFGTWWRIEVGGQSGWIRETDLKGRL